MVLMVVAVEMVMGAMESLPLLLTSVVLVVKGKTPHGVGNAHLIRVEVLVLATIL